MASGELAELHGVCAGGGSRILDTFEESSKFRVGADLGREVSHDGAFSNFGDGDQGCHGPHCRALQFILFLELLLHGTSLHLRKDRGHAE